MRAAGASADPRRILAGWYRRRNVRALAKALFGVDLKPGQARIVRAVLFEEHRRIAVKAYTQYGKTWCVALAVCLLFLFSRRPLEVQVISATKAQAERLRQYLAGFITSCPQLAAELAVDVAGIDRIRKEVSKDRLTFKSGHAIGIQTAHGSADRLMGIGGDIVIKDEAGLISDEADAKILRMLGGRVDGTIIELGNPWSRLSGFFKSCSDPAYHVVTIDYEQGLAEGRLTPEFIAEQRRRLAPIMFTVLYEAEFPEDVEDALFRWTWIERALNREPLTDEHTGPRMEWGLDIAEFGADQNVLVIGRRLGGRASVTGIHSWEKVDTMETARRAAALVQPAWAGRGDANGVGSGAVSRLQEQGYDVAAYKSSVAARESDRFANRKAEDYWALRDLLEKGAHEDSLEWLSLPREHEHANAIVRDLARARYEIRNGRIVVWHEGEDTPGGSPDFSDALVMFTAPHRTSEAAVINPGVKRAVRGHTPGEFYAKTAPVGRGGRKRL